jgi:uncharacterized membrane protein
LAHISAYVIIAGFIFFILGIIIIIFWNISFEQLFLDSAIDEVVIEPKNSTNATIQVNNMDQSISVVVHASPSNATITEIIQDPDDLVISVNRFTQEFFTSFRPEKIGAYTLTITNFATKPVTISAVYDYLPINGNGSKRVELNIGAILIGSILIIIGLICIMLGIILGIMHRARGKR